VVSASENRPIREARLAEGMRAGREAAGDRGVRAREVQRYRRVEAGWKGCKSERGVAGEGKCCGCWSVDGR
jgi:hypothetical protein